MLMVEYKSKKITRRAKPIIFRLFMIPFIHSQRSSLANWPRGKKVEQNLDSVTRNSTSYFHPARKRLLCISNWSDPPNNEQRKVILQRYVLVTVYMVHCHAAPGAVTVVRSRETKKAKRIIAIRSADYLQSGGHNSVRDRFHGHYTYYTRQSRQATASASGVQIPHVAD